MSKKKEPRYGCINEARASHQQRRWAEVSSSAPHLLHNGLSDNPIGWRYFLRVLCPVWRPVTTPDCVLLKDRNLALAPRQGPKNEFSTLSSGITKTSMTWPSSGKGGRTWSNHRVRQQTPSFPLQNGSHC